MEEERPAQESESGQDKDIWTAVKDNAALVAAIIGLFGVVITGAINTYIANKDQVAQQKLEAFNAQKQRDLEQEKTQDAALQTYLDQMGQMLLNKDLRSSEVDSDQRTLARARTLTTLRALDASRKTQVLRFLSEANLVQVPSADPSDPILSLANADLREVDLSDTDLIYADLFEANLSRADLSKANLSTANLNGANLFEADLSEAELSSANLISADLSRANLHDADPLGAYLTQADLNDADLSKANLFEADLKAADLSKADLSKADLFRANLYEANLSDADLSKTDLSDANLNATNLSGADLSGAYATYPNNTETGELESKRLIPNEELEQQADTLEGATMPNGQKYEEWLKSEGSREDGGEQRALPPGPDPLTQQRF